MSDYFHVPCYAPGNRCIKTALCQGECAATPTLEPVAALSAEPAHTDHPLRHWDRTCPACNASIDYSAEPVQEMTDETKAYAEGRGDQFDDDCAIVRELFHELNDVDVMNDGFINTTRVREMLAYFDVAAPAECSGLECTRAECSALGCLADRINTERERLIADRASRLPEMGEGDWPELPVKRRAMLCTKCGHSGPTDAPALPTGAQCPKCSYMAFVKECDYNDAELRAYGVAAVEKYKALVRGKA